MFVLHYVAQILKDVVPLMEHPSESFLAILEGNLVKIIMNYGQLVCAIDLNGNVVLYDGYFSNNHMTLKGT